MYSAAIRSACTYHPRRLLQPTSLRSFSSSKPPAHNSDSYNKDEDSTPPPDSTIHRVDPSSDRVQKPHEPPSGEWSWAGVRTSEYQTMSKTEPYTIPGEGKRYGGKEMYGKEKGPEISKPDEGPEGKASKGMK